MEFIDFKNVYWNYYLQIEEDFLETTPYCTVDECNDNTFSIKYLQLHLTICSEIDTICKTFCKELDSSLDLNSCGIMDYLSIFNRYYPSFAGETVSLHGHKYRVMQPWKGIDKDHIPNWWNVYNSIKHRRDAVKNNKKNYEYASQKNILQALGALYVPVEYWAAMNFVTDNEQKENLDMPKLKSKLLHLVKWRFYLNFMGSGERFSNELYRKYIQSGG